MVIERDFGHCMEKKIGFNHWMAIEVQKWHPPFNSGQEPLFPFYGEWKWFQPLDGDYNLSWLTFNYD